jgi:GH25 family lysozyme M1 (1,4-beta-N-acetylmuramidase)
MKVAYDLSFGFVKATESTNFTDDRFDDNWPAIRAAGLVRGAYHFARPGDSSANAQADYFVNFVNAHGGFDGTDLPILDFETSGGLGTNVGLEWCNDWGDRVRARTGLVPLIYFGGWAADDVGTPTLRDHFCAWWYPRYPNEWANRAAWPGDYSDMTLPSNNRWGETPDIWQYSQSFPVDGDPHDANVSKLTLAQLQSLNTHTADGAVVALTQADADLVAATIMARAVDKTTPSETGTITFKAAIESTRRWANMALTTLADDANPDINVIKADVAAVKASLAALVAQGPPVVTVNVDVDEAEIVAALTPALQALNQLSVETLQSIADAVGTELSARLGA